jgi:hypothetical protein
MTAKEIEMSLAYGQCISRLYHLKDILLMKADQARNG